MSRATMRRLQLIEIEDEPWCPPAIRDAATDYLQFLITLTRSYDLITAKLQEGLERSGAKQVIDLCSGAGGPWLSLQETLAKSGSPIHVCLTDSYPNLQAFRRLEALSHGRIGFFAEPVDARKVPAELRGFRTIFSSFHHFPPDEARAILQDAVDQGQGIAVFEAVARQPWMMLLACLNPLLLLIVTPLIRPFRWSRLFWSYLVPAVPFITLFDGLVSCLRSYSLLELQELTRELSASNYRWRLGRAKRVGSLLPVTYLIGYPVSISG